MAANVYPLQIFQQTANSVPAGVYSVIDGVPGLSIHITDYMVSSTAGITTFSDTLGNVLLTLNGQASSSSNWLNATLPVGAGLQVTCNATTNLNATIKGYVAA